jgi:hypothetical protein
MSNVAVKRAGFRAIELSRSRDHRHSGDDPAGFQNTRESVCDIAEDRLAQPRHAEEAYLFDNDAYTAVVSALSYTSSPGVVLQVTNATASGWSASATHPAAFPLTCALFVGNVPPLAPATVDGLIGCQ